MRYNAEFVSVGKLTLYFFYVLNLAYKLIYKMFKILSNCINSNVIPEISFRLKWCPYLRVVLSYICDQINFILCKRCLGIVIN